MQRMSSRYAVLCSILLLGVTAGFCWAQKGRNGLPARLTDLTQLGSLEQNVDLTPYQKTQVLLTWLNEELRKPTPTRQGLGGDLGSGWILAQIITALSTQGDPRVMSALARQKQTSPDTRDAIIIALGLMGDASREGELITILQHHRIGYFRARAAQALRVIGATQATPVLKKTAKQDQYAVAAANSFQGSFTDYPVRRNATEALRAFSDPKQLASAKKRTEAFRKRTS